MFGQNVAWRFNVIQAEKRRQTRLIDYLFRKKCF